MEAASEGLNQGSTFYAHLPVEGSPRALKGAVLLLDKFYRWCTVSGRQTKNLTSGCVVMKASTTLLSALVAAAVLTLGVLAAAHLAFAGRVPLGVSLGSVSLTGVPRHELPSLINKYESSVLNRTVTLRLRGREERFTLAELGVSVDSAATSRQVEKVSLSKALAGTGAVPPVLRFDEKIQRTVLEEKFSELTTPARNATLEISPAGHLSVVPSRPGESFDLRSLRRQLDAAARVGRPHSLITLKIIRAEAQVQDDEVDKARALAERLLKEGITFTFDENDYLMKPYTVKRLLAFAEQVDPENHNHHILGVKLDPEGLAGYLNNTIAPQINQTAVDARFAVSGSEQAGLRVTQFALPQKGQALDVKKTAGALAAALARFENTAPLAVKITEPQVTDSGDMEKLGITSLLATGQSDFAGSPRNRAHNIRVGAQRFHGLLIAPGEEFSFNEHLGPVTSAAGFLPELVIKKNVTTPELGGGLCQVSTTAFRAALNNGLKITSRRSHAYIVRYYGTPGLDATIYPPYTDLRFANNTPGYILIQTKVEGTKLTFSFWGTDDGRRVDIVGPVVYDRKPDGSAKAHVTQKVTKRQQTVVDDTFYSRYRSPKLFPKVLAAGEASMPASDPEDTPSPTPKPSASPKPSPSSQPSPTPHG